MKIIFKLMEQNATHKSTIIIFLCPSMLIIIDLIALFSYLAVDDG